MIFTVLDVSLAVNLCINCSFFLHLSGISRSLKLMPFKSFGAVSYSPSIVTMAVSVAACEIFSIKAWCDLENKVRVRSR